MDIYLVNSGPSDFFKPSRPLRNALYRNNRDGTFTDVTEKAGVAGGTFGMGVAVGDYDNDGWPDLFVTAYGRCILYRNNRDGTFTDVTRRPASRRRAGRPARSGSTTTTTASSTCSCAASSILATTTSLCGDNQLGRHYYCIPRFFKPTPVFCITTTATAHLRKSASGTDIARFGKAFGVVATDINNDGLMDLFVANDTVQNFLFVNRGRASGKRARWLPKSLSAPSGQPRSGMGVDAADFDQDGFQDLFVANVDQEMFSLYRNQKAKLSPTSRTPMMWRRRPGC